MSLFRSTRLCVALLALTACASQPVSLSASPDTKADVETHTEGVPDAPSAQQQVADTPGLTDALATQTEVVAHTDVAIEADDVADTATQVFPVAQEEDDFTAIYGGDTSSSAHTGQTVWDPWERMNRKVHSFNIVVDRTIARPVARAYVTVVPQPVRTGISNFYDNLLSPLAFGNLLLQGRPGDAAEILGRFLVNSTFGLAGLFDPASKQLKMHRHAADFGRTFARWGWKQSRYVELPFLGPSTVRDGFGSVGDLSLSPLTYAKHDKTRLSLQALRIIDLRAGLLPLDAMRENAPDDYTLTRDAWFSRRQYLLQTDGSQRDEGSETLPAYLLDDETP